MLTIIRDLGIRHKSAAEGISATLVFIFRSGLGLLFLFSGISKLIDVQSLAVTIKSLSIGLGAVATEVAFLLCIVEILAGILLTIGLFTRHSSLAVMLLLIVFIAVFLPQLMVQNEVDCNCFGPFISSRVDATFFVRDLLLLAMVFIVHYKEKQILAVDNLISKGENS
jgi:uncharacterized membrane protein YphA (DoxX/SURF4 family)